MIEAEAQLRGPSRHGPVVFRQICCDCPIESRKSFECQAAKVRTCLDRSLWRCLRALHPRSCHSISCETIFPLLYRCFCCSWISERWLFALLSTNYTAPRPEYSKSNLRIFCLCFWTPILSLSLNAANVAHSSLDRDCPW